MRAFLESLDEQVWISIEKSWTQPTININLWFKDDINACSWNNKGLNAIFMAVSPKELKRISMHEIAKEAWKILEVIHIGTNIDKNCKLELLTSRFEEIRIKEDETFDEFYAKLNNLVNSSFNLREKIPKNIIVRKNMRSLLKRFRLKVTAIEESKYLDTMMVEELVGSIQTYKLSLPQPKRNNMALKNARE
jgi:hypothetical protein